ncbi:hypothetical protein H2204_002410 [Knufia peltigerae]|uniref:DUF6536 domain-containing protein n=1 Tax=Knufia peltigerae TaxID=1002370 RepID=A0AA38YBG8_9EURO|nr:hypothetical protein H2204_002410 [Knufia peltigerae]
MASNFASVKRNIVLGITYPSRAYKQFWDYRHTLLNKESQSPKDARRQWAQIHPSLKTGYTFCLYNVASILVVTLIVAIWAGASHRTGDGLVVTLFNGDCSTASEANFWVHLLINVLASSLFATSSYMMQRLAAPTREDLDRAHRINKTLNVGTLSLTNFALLSKQRLAVFALLWSSSLPIHPMFNSLIVYSTTNAEWSSWAMLVEVNDAPSSAPPNSTFRALKRSYIDIPTVGSSGASQMANLAYYLNAQKPPLTKLTAEECIQTYASGSSRTWGDVLLMTTTSIDSSTEDFPSDVVKYPGQQPGFDWNNGKVDLSYVGDQQPWAWLCYEQTETSYSTTTSCDTSRLLENGTWMVHQRVVDHCLARDLPDACELNLSLSIMIVVLVCIFGKLVAMLAALSFSHAQPLVTIGDAIDSFLHEPDTTVHGLCMADARHFGEPALDRKLVSIAKPHPYGSRDARIAQEVSGPWVGANFLGLVGLGLSFGLFGWSYHQTRAAHRAADIPFGFGTIWGLGLGKAPTLYTYDEAQFMVYNAANTPAVSYMTGAVLANLPHLALSFLYLTYNNQFTRIFMAFEFRSFATHRRGLRVSKPKSGTEQRGTYFLQFPLRYSIIMISYFVLLHTFLSETLFLQRIYAVWPQSFDNADDIGKRLVSKLGFSPLAALVFSLILLVLVTFAIGIGFWKVSWILPSTFGNSKTLAAYCHPPEGSKNTQEGQVRWGVTRMNAEDIGQCSFSLLPVRPPEEGEHFVIGSETPECILCATNVWVSADWKSPLVQIGNGEVKQIQVAADQV